MRALKQIVVGVFFFVGFLSANPYIKAMKVPGNVSNLTPSSKAWLSAGFSEVVLYPQTTLGFFEKEAKKVKVKALYDGENISFLLQWKDLPIDAQMDSNTSVYLDGFALQFPQNYDDVNKLPYIDMGSENRPVSIHLLQFIQEVEALNIFDETYDTLGPNLYYAFFKTYEEKEPIEYQKDFISEGYGFTSEIEDEKAQMYISYENNTWKGTLSKKLQTKHLDLQKGAFLVGLVLWDGKQKREKEAKLLSSWIPVKLIGKSDESGLLKKFSPTFQADIQNGKQFALENCAICHRYKDNNSAPQFMAPNLSNIGGYGTKEYIKESLEQPSAIIVPQDDNSSNPNFVWYTLKENGERNSIMPSYNWMDEKSKNDLISFLSTLKSEVEK